MCTIMAYKGTKIPKDRFIKGLEKTITRGPDDTRVIAFGDIILGFQRLSIMGLTPEGMQPFELDGDYVVCNWEIFEKYYPGVAKTVKDFWMPNREWEGCKDANDPSARVLSNYGDSAK